MSARKVRRGWDVRRRRAIAGLVTLVVIASAWTEAGGSARPLGRRMSGAEGFYRVHTREKIVALSFDDGPDPAVTPAVLALLAKYGDHATFFDVGRRVLEEPALALAEIAAGDEIGNHTFDHRPMTVLSRDGAASEIVRTDDALSVLGLPKPSLFRPPYGLILQTGVADARSLGHRVAMWSLAMDKYMHGRDAAASARLLLAAVRPGDIILAHDCCRPYDRMRTRFCCPRSETADGPSRPCPVCLQRTPPECGQPTRYRDAAAKASPDGLYGK
jgi:peptidoglycan-N-acetylglucosamine deacetylase